MQFFADWHKYSSTAHLPLSEWKWVWVKVGSKQGRGIRLRLAHSPDRIRFFVKKREIGLVPAHLPIEGKFGQIPTSRSTRYRTRFHGKSRKWSRTVCGGSDVTRIRNTSWNKPSQTSRNIHRATCFRDLLAKKRYLFNFLFILPCRPCRPDRRKIISVKKGNTFWSKDL